MKIRINAVLLAAALAAIAIAVVSGLLWGVDGAYAGATTGLIAFIAVEIVLLVLLVTGRADDDS